MLGRERSWIILLAAAFLSLAAAPVGAQLPELDGGAALYVPERPATKEERDQREALHQYALGLLCEREDRVLEALKAFEKAAHLNPKAAAAFKAQVPLYLALERTAEALAATRKTLDLNPDDFEVWFLYARQLKELDKLPEARDALRRGLASSHVKEYPELLQQMTFELGLVHEGIGEHLDAAKAFTQAARILDHPDVFLERGNLPRERIAQRAAEIYERAGGMYLRAKKHDDALAAYRLAQERSPEGAGRLNLYLAQIFHDKTQLPEALNHLDAYLRLQPQGLEAYELKINLLRTLQRSEEIVPWLERASKADPYNLGLKALMARQLGLAGQRAVAENLFLELTATSPSPQLYTGLFSLYQDGAGQEPAKVISTVNEAIEAARQRPPIPNKAAQAKAMIAALRLDASIGKVAVKTGARSAKVSELHPDTLLFLAALADHYRMPTESEQLFRVALTRIGRSDRREAPGFDPPTLTPENEPLAYGGLLRVLWKGNKIDDVIQVCQQGLEKAATTNSVLFHSELAKALARKGKTDEALAAGDRALAVAADTDRLVIRCLRVRLLTFAQQYDRAEAECLAMLAQYSQPGEILEVRYLLSGIHSSARNFDKAVEQLEQVLKIDPNNATACNDLGYLWADQNKNLDKAEELIRKAIDLERRQRKGLPNAAAEADHDNAAYIDSLGWVLFRRGQIDAARVELERAAALPDGDDPVIWDHLGDVYQRLGIPSRARGAWERARQLYQQENRRRMDDRYQELLRKLEKVEREGASR